MNETTDTYIGADGGYYVAGRLVAREIYERVMALQAEVEKLRAALANAWHEQGMTDGMPCLRRRSPRSKWTTYRLGWWQMPDAVSGNKGPRESDPQGHVFRSIDGEPILPDAHANECALCGKSEAYHSNAHQHGPTCAETPVDHRCGDTEIDQGTTWADSAAYRSAQLKAVLDLHQNTKASGGAVTGYCCECNWQWPCPTYHIVAGWGIESYHECEEAGWCKHAEVKMNRRELSES